MTGTLRRRLAASKRLLLAAASSITLLLGLGVATAGPAHAITWNQVVDDEFNSGGIPAHWHSYDGKYSSSDACGSPLQSSVSGGYLQMVMQYRTGAKCDGVTWDGWYTGGLELSGYAATDVKVQVRWRVVPNGANSHHIIPMRWPHDDGSDWTYSEQDWCETSSTTACTTYLHYGSTGSDQVSHSYTFDQTAWHTTMAVQSGNDYSFWLDGTQQWDTTSSNLTAGQNVPRDVVLQQECPSTCPSNHSGTETIQIDWIKVSVPS